MELKEINIKDEEGVIIAEIESDKLIIKELQDALDLMADCTYRGANKIIMHEKNITDDFFNLRTGIAGEILQKFSNYKVSLAIVGDFSKYKSNSLKKFIYESNKYNHVVFTDSIEEARIRLKN